VDAPPFDALALACVIVLVVFVLKSVFDYTQAFLMASVEQASIRDLRHALFAHLQRLSLAFYHGPPRRDADLAGDERHGVPARLAGLGDQQPDQGRPHARGRDGGGAVAVVELALMAFVILPPLALAMS
jgi:ABC-type multidrug transport system fused ATPase/permease subunit